ncbi:hypothetical protein J437_LFUL003830 [Ladona fulva]|uniref:Chitin-binding type-2 domain-containing protein n=1 Tax=Ladona fulva TaxID=123851 RepID=A0A8K0KGG2_LADFU|nr:hypothetical protein J437_LFUL003830 [Ladona fulva]
MFMVIIVWNEYSNKYSHSVEACSFFNLIIDLKQFFLLHRCENNKVISTHKCGQNAAFSTNVQGCVRATEVACVEPRCPLDGPGINATFITPGTQCRAYHICGRNGLRGDFLCPLDYLFDHTYNKCVSSPRVCHEPICTGRVDGSYPDSSENCKRSFCCRGGHLTAVIPCPEDQLFGPPCLPSHLVTCPLLSSTSVSILIGGNRPAKILIPANSGPCSHLKDGLHRNFSGDGCRRYFRCHNGKLVSRNSCPPQTSLVILPSGNDTVASCIASSLLLCVPLGSSITCGSIPGTNCGSYVDCEDGENSQGKAVLLACPQGQAFNGYNCVPTHEAPSCKEVVHKRTKGSPCAGLRDGYHTDPGSPSCRGYIYCGGGHSISYICPRGFAFNGEQCAPAQEVKCNSSVVAENKTCAEMWSGYVADRTSGCHSYFFCQAGDLITTLTCPDGQIFDGRRCVLGDNCAPKSNECASLPDGFYPDLYSGCRTYFKCTKGFQKESQTCPEGSGFDGKSCTVAALLSCSFQTVASSSVLYRSPCQHGNGFFQDIESGCHRYFYCIDGEKTWLSCQGNDVFDGQVCVPAGTYTCPAITPYTCLTPHCNKSLRIAQVLASISGRVLFFNSVPESSIEKTAVAKEK